MARGALCLPKAQTTGLGCHETSFPPAWQQQSSSWHDLGWPNPLPIQGTACLSVKPGCKQECLCVLGGRPGGKLVGLLKGTVSLCVTWGCGGKLLRCSYLSSISKCHPTNHGVTLAPALVTPRLGTFFPSSGDGTAVLPLLHQGASLWEFLAESHPDGPVLITAADMTPSGKCGIFESGPETRCCLSSARGSPRCFGSVCSFFAASDLQKGMYASGDTPTLQPHGVLWEDLRHALLSSRM